MQDRQFWATLVIAVFIFVLIIRLVQKGRLDMAYSWLWLCMGAGMILVVMKYEWLVFLTECIGAITPTTTLFLFAILILFILCLHLSIVVSRHRCQIKRITQQLAVKTAERPRESRNDEARTCDCTSQS
jgi:hypothetical protein